MAALILLLLGIVNLRLHLRAWSLVVFMASMLLGCFIAYLIFLSHLTCTEWNWLIVPFNPLPVLLWRWRSRWLLPLAAVDVAWAAAMLLLPHEVVDTPHVVLALALAAAYAELDTQNKKHKRYEKPFILQTHAVAAGPACRHNEDVCNRLLRRRVTHIEGYRRWPGVCV